MGKPKPVNPQLINKWSTKAFPKPPHQNHETPLHRQHPKRTDPDRTSPNTTRESTPATHRTPRQPTQKSR